MKVDWGERNPIPFSFEARAKREVLLELKEVRSLVALAELGSLKLTAERLNLSAAAIHKQLKALESELGVCLYEKFGHRLQLAQAAEILIPRFRNMLAHYDGALLALDEWKGMKRGVVRIGAGPTLSSYILPVLLKKYQRAHPDIDLLVESGHTPVLLDKFREAKLDLALLVSPELHESSDIVVETSWQFEMVLVSGRTLAHPCRLADLRNQRFILFHKGSRMEEPIDRYFAAHGFEPRVLMRFDNAEAIKAMIHSGLGISMLPMWIVDADLRDGRLQLIQQEEPPLVSQIVLARRRAGYLAQAVREFIAQAQHLRWTRPRLSMQPVERAPKKRVSS